MCIRIRNLPFSRVGPVFSPFSSLVMWPNPRLYEVCKLHFHCIQNRENNTNLAGSGFMCQHEVMQRTFECRPGFLCAVDTPKMPISFPSFILKPLLCQATDFIFLNSVLSLAYWKYHLVCWASLLSSLVYFSCPLHPFRVGFLLLWHLIRIRIKHNLFKSSLVLF